MQQSSRYATLVQEARSRIKEVSVDEMRDAASIRAEFHPELGYPTQVFVDYHENTADEERGYRVLALEPLRAGE